MRIKIISICDLWLWKDKSNTTNKLHGAEKYISTPNFKNLSIFSENLVAIQLDKTKIILDRPIYVGFSILEISKAHLYSFHYSVMKNMYEGNIKLCYTDTDNLLYYVKTDDFYKDMKKIFNILIRVILRRTIFIICLNVTCKYPAILNTKWDEKSFQNLLVYTPSYTV